jgi:hypothetical protein
MEIIFSSQMKADIYAKRWWLIYMYIIDVNTYTFTLMFTLVLCKFLMINTITSWL